MFLPGETFVDALGNVACVPCIMFSHMPPPAIEVRMADIRILANKAPAIVLFGCRCCKALNFKRIASKGAFWLLASDVS